MTNKNKQQDHAGGGGSSLAPCHEGEDHQARGKFMDKKRSKSAGLVPGCPEIAAPWQKKNHELQMSFFTARFLKMIGWAGYDEKEGRERRKTGHEMRCELQVFLHNGIDRLLDLALREANANAKHWAGALLANISGWIEKHDKKLRELNGAYCDEKKKIGKLRTDLLFPKPVMAAVKRELRKAERYRKRLEYFKTGYSKKWKAAVRRHNRESRQKIPEAYWPFAGLLEFSVKSERKWWKLLWPLIKKNNPSLLEKLRGGKFPTRGIRHQSRWATYCKEFRRRCTHSQSYEAVGYFKA